MSEYTAEDFAQATVATRGDDDVARRIDDDHSPWRAYMPGEGAAWRSDEEMARGGWTPVVESRITLDALAAAYEAAEVPTDDDPIRAGDVMIFPVPEGYAVREALVDDGLWRSDTRILSRAPKREPWEDLADVLAVEMPGIEDEPRIEALAKALYCEHGVRVAGGDES